MKSRRLRLTSSFGTMMEASRNTSECAQNATCRHTPSRNDQLTGSMRVRPSALTVMPAVSVATTPETWNTWSATM